MAVFNNLPKGKHPRLRLHYGDPVKARESIRRLKRQPRAYQFQGAQTMLARATYHKHQTKGMRASAKLYREFLRSITQKGGGACSYHPTERDRMYLRRWKRGKSIGFTMRSSLKAKGMIPRANGTRRVSDKYCS
jgi:hypothetical protein